MVNNRVSLKDQRRVMYLFIRLALHYQEHFLVTFLSIQSLIENRFLHFFNRTVFILIFIEKWVHFNVAINQIDWVRYLLKDC